MKRRLIIAGIVLIAGIALALYIRFGNSRNQNALTLSGNIEVTEVNMGFKIPGRVQGLYTDEGRTVTRGEKLATLDSAEFESMVNQSNASVRNAEAHYEKAHKDYERFTILYGDGVIATQQMDAAKSAYDAAVSQLQLSRASLRTADIKLKDTVIYSTSSY